MYGKLFLVPKKVLTVINDSMHHCKPCSGPDQKFWRLIFKVPDFRSCQFRKNKYVFKLKTLTAFCFKDCKYFFSLFETNQIKHFKMPLWLFYDCEIGAKYVCLVLLWVQNNFGPAKSFWSSTNRFGRVQFVLVGSKSFCTVSNYKNYSIKV